MYVPVISHYFRETFAKQKNALANSTFKFRQRSFWHTEGHRILHSRQGPLHPLSYVIYNIDMIVVVSMDGY